MVPTFLPFWAFALWSYSLRTTTRRSPNNWALDQTREAWRCQQCLCWSHRPVPPFLREWIGWCPFPQDFSCTAGCDCSGFRPDFCSLSRFLRSWKISQTLFGPHCIGIWFRGLVFPFLRCWRDRRFWYFRAVLIFS